jgi:PAS domain S-box-containing protein
MILTMNIPEILTEYRESIIRDWVHKLHTEVSPVYSAERTETLFRTCSAACDANFSAFVHNDFSRLDVLVEYIGNLRGKAGFPLSDVQKAFELYRTLVTPILIRESEGQSAMVANLERLNFCLSYTIHKFSDYFQALSEKQIREYAQTLELKVEERTKELAESEDKYRTLVEEMRDGYFVNEGGKIIYANRSFCRMHGYRRSEVIGRTYTDFVSPESVEEIKKIYEKRLSGADSKEQYVYFRLHKDGRSLPTENRVNVVRYQGMVAALVTCSDITERIRIEERIREAEQLAHIGQLTTSLAHEIRNPLSAASMGIQMLLKNPVFTGVDRRRLEILAFETTRLNKIVTDMLDFARPIKFDFARASIVDLIQSSLDVMGPRIREKKIAVWKKFPRIPPSVMMDYEKMEQVVINLLLNSIEAIRDDGEIRITVGRLKNQAVRVQIADNGSGISTEDMPFIFDPFFSKKTKGTGLGLSNVKKILEAHGGSIKVIPEIPHGVCMSFTVPYEGNPEGKQKKREVSLK